MNVSKVPCRSYSSLLGPDGKPLCRDAGPAEEKISVLILPDAPAFKRTVETLAADEGGKGFFSGVQSQLGASQRLSGILNGEAGAPRFERDEDRARFLTLVTTTAA